MPVRMHQQVMILGTPTVVKVIGIPEMPAKMAAANGAPAMNGMLETMTMMAPTLATVVGKPRARNGRE